MGGSKQTQQTQQQSSTTTQLPGWMTSAGQSLFDQAQQQKPVGAYGGQMAAGPSANQSAASAAAANNAGSWAGDLNASRAMTSGAAYAPAASISTSPTSAATMTAANQGFATTGQTPQTSAATQGFTGYTAAGGGVAPTVQAGSVGGSTFDGAAAARYMSPYTGAVQADTLRQMDLKNTQDMAALDDSAQGSRAFGGTRQAVLEGELARNQNLARNDYINSSNAAAFANAQGQFNTDRAANDALATGNADRAMAAGTTNASLLNQMFARADAANQFNASAANAAAGANADRQQQTGATNAGFQQQSNLANQSAANAAAAANAGFQQQAGAANMAATNATANDNANRALDVSKANAGSYETMLSRMFAGAGLAGQTAHSQAALGSQDISNLAATGATDQATNQNADTAAYNEYLRAGNAPLENIKDIMAILQGTPRNVTTTGNSSGTTTTTQQQSLFNQLMGVGALGLSAYTGGMFTNGVKPSDRRLKTDIDWIDNLPNGLGVYRYRYVWDRPDDPQHIGVMADEVERIVPEALGPAISGFKTVDYSKLGGMLPCY